MEANFFRFLCPRAGQVLAGARIDKVFFPAPGLWTLSLSGLRREDFPASGKAPKYFLGGRASGRFLFFFSETKPENPFTPDAVAMWLRKRLRGRRVLGAVCDWPTRRLALSLSPGEFSFLLIDPLQGLKLVDALPEGFGAEIKWPSFEEAASSDEIWKRYPQATPALRRVLGALAPASGRRLLERLTRGDETEFFLYAPEKGTRELLPFELPGSLGAKSLAGTFDDPLHAAAAFGEPLLFAAAGAAERKEAVAGDKRRAKRAKRRAVKLDEDERRMRRFVEEGGFGRAIAANLHALNSKAKAAALDLPDAGGQILHIPLDPSRTILENMERFFARAAKGKRGLAHVERLRREPMPAPGPGRSRKAQGGTPDAPDAAIPKKYQGEAVNLYRTSDGFLAVRGKNAKANDRLLTRLAGPDDLWFHVEGGPGAHVILRRDHPGQEAPRRSLEEAAALAALSSYRSGSGRADVIMAHVRDVRKFKGAASGQVAVDKVERTLRVALDPELEARLKLT